jgi:hypothetical protein
LEAKVAQVVQWTRNHRESGRSAKITEVLWRQISMDRGGKVDIGDCKSHIGLLFNANLFFFEDTIKIEANG